MMDSSLHGASIPHRPAAPDNLAYSSSPLLKRPWRAVPSMDVEIVPLDIERNSLSDEGPMRAGFKLSFDHKGLDDNDEEDEEDVVEVQEVVGLNSASSGDEQDSPKLAELPPRPPGPPAKLSHVPRPPKRPAKTEALRILTPSPLVIRTVAAAQRTPERNPTPEDLTAAWVHKGRKAMLASLGVEDGGLGLAGLLQAAASTQFRSKLRTFAGGPPGVVYLSSRLRTLAPNEWKAARQVLKENLADNALPGTGTTTAPVMQKKEQDAAIEHVPTAFSMKRYAASTNFVPLDQVQAWRDILQQPPSTRSEENLRMLESACLSRVSLFAEAAPALRTFLLRHATYVKLAKGEELFHQQDLADGLYVILAGFAQIVIDMGQVSMADVELTDLRRFANVSEDGVINTLGPLEAFGEQGLLVFFRELLDKCYPDAHSMVPAIVSNARVPRAFFPEDSPQKPARQRSHSVDYTPQKAADLHQSFRQRRGSLAMPHVAVESASPVSRRIEETVQYERFLHLLKATVESSTGLRWTEERGGVSPRSVKSGESAPSPQGGMKVRSTTEGPTAHVGSLLHPPISPRGMQNQRILSAMLDPPDGSPPLEITGGHRLATVLAAPDTDLHLLKIPAIPYLYLLARNRREVQDVATLALKHTNVFSFWPEETIDHLSATAVRKTYRPGDVILKQGEEANGVFIILLGHCRVLRELTMSEKRRQVFTKKQQSSGSLPTSRSTVDRVPMLDLSSRNILESSSPSELDEMRSARLNHLEALARPSRESPDKQRPIVPSLSKASFASGEPSVCKPAPTVTVDIMRLRKLDTFGFADSILGTSISDSSMPTNSVSAVLAGQGGVNHSSVRHGVRARRKLQSEKMLQNASSTDVALAAMKRERRRSSLSAILDAVKNAQALGIKQVAQPGVEGVLPDAHTHAVIATPHAYSQSLVAETRVEGVFIPRAPVLLDACLADPVLAQKSWDAAVIDVPTDAEVTTQVSNAMSWNSYKFDLQHTIFVDQSNRKAAASLSAVDVAETPIVPPQVYQEASHDRVFNNYMSQLIESSTTRRTEKTVLDASAARQTVLKSQRQHAKQLAQSARPTAQHFTLLPDDADMLASKMRKFVTTEDLGLQLPARARRRSLQSEAMAHLGPNPSIQSLALEHDLLSQQSAATLVTVPSQELVARLLAADSAHVKSHVQTRHIVLTPLPLTDSESEDDGSNDPLHRSPAETPGITDSVGGMVEALVVPHESDAVVPEGDVTGPATSSASVEKVCSSPGRGAASSSNASLKLIRNGSQFVAKHDARSHAVRFAKLASKLSVPADLETGRRAPAEPPRSHVDSSFVEYSHLPLSHVLSSQNPLVRQHARPIVPTNTTELRKEQSPRRRHAQLHMKKASTFRRKSISVEMESFAGGLHSANDSTPTALTSRPASPVRSTDVPTSLLTVDLHSSKKHLFLEKFTVPSTFAKNKVVAGEGSFTDPPPFAGAYHALPLSSLTLGMSMPDLAPSILKKVLSRSTMIRSPDKRTSAASLLQTAGQRAVSDGGR